MSSGSLTETRVQEGKCTGIMTSTLPGWKVITNYDYSPLGRIWFCWKEDVVVTLLHKTKQVITCAVQKTVSGEQFIYSEIYASNSMVERRQLWDELRNTKAAYAHLSLP